MTTTIINWQPPERYDGWLTGMWPATIEWDTYRTENLVNFSHGWTELSRMKWSQPLRLTWRTSETCYFLSLVLDGGSELERRNVGLSGAETRTGLYGGRRMRLVPPGQTIYSVSAETELRTMHCFIEAAYIESICAQRPNGAERARLGAIDFGGGKIEWLLLRMYREITSAEIGMPIVVDSIARELAVEIARCIEQLRPREIRHAGGLPPWRMRLILSRIQAEGALPSVAELAELCGMTERHLARSFRAETGKTLGKFIAAAMAERAGRLLEAGHSVGAVAAALGYASSSSFAHAFHRETGSLPSNIREAGALRQSESLS